MKIVFRILHALMALLFLYAAALQYNDADPVRWIAIYLAAATVCLSAAGDRPQPRLAAVVALIALAWSMLYVLDGAWRVPLPALFSQWEMKDASIVGGREMYGLFIISLGMALAWKTGRKSAAPTA